MKIRKILTSLNGMWLLFCLMGVVFLIASICIFIIHKQFLANAKFTEGEIINIKVYEDEDGNSYAPIIKYKTANNEVIITKTSSFLSPPYGKDKFYIGQKIKIRYDTSNPKKIFLLGFYDNWGVALVFACLGIIFFPLGGIMLYYNFRKEKRLQWLKMYGKKIEANFDAIEVNYGYTINDIHPFIIYCSWLDKSTKVIYNFKTKENILEDPTPFIPLNNKISVLINQDKPQKEYLIDISFIPLKPK